MKLGKWVLGIAALTLILGGTADAQNSKLCLHNGSEYYYGGAGYHCFDNHCASKYFPAYTHLPGLNKSLFPPQPFPAVDFPWKIAGWAWDGMQGFGTSGPIWYWETCLMYCRDNPRFQKTTETFDMTFDYPVVFCTGLGHTGAPYPIYGGTIPNTVPAPWGGNEFQSPSSCGPNNPYRNIFALGAGSWNISGTQPGYGFQFAFTLPCDYPIMVPSVAGTDPCTCTSIWETVYMCKGQNEQYVLFSGNEGDCNIADRSDDGNKTRNYSIIGDCDGNWLWYWNNTCDGRGEEFGLCLMLCDTVTIPVNAPAGPDGLGANPFQALGFDVGPGSLTPYKTEGCALAGFMTDDGTPYGACGALRFILAGFGACPQGFQYAKGGRFKIHHPWNLLTDVFVGIAGVFIHGTAPGYPACCFGTTCGGNSLILGPWPPDAPSCFEITMESIALAPKLPPSAGYTIVLF
jgi:hypothetical protein